MADTCELLLNRNNNETIGSFGISAEQTSSIINRAVAFKQNKQVEPTIAVDPANSNNLIAAWIDFRNSNSTTNDYHIGYGFSVNSGASWYDAGLLPDPPGYNLAGDPSLVANNYGPNKYHMAYVAQYINNVNFTFDNSIWVVNWNGSTWSAPIRIDQATSVDDDKPWMTVDRSDGRLYLSYRENEKIRVSYSSNYGNDWTVSSSVLGGYGPNYSMPVVDANGVVYVLWRENNKLLLSKSTDRGINFSQGACIKTGNDCLDISTFGARGSLASLIYSGHAVPINPVIACNPNSGTLYVCWNNSRPPIPPSIYYRSDVLFIRSTNQGTTWSTPINIMTNSQFGTNNYVRTTGDQFLPWMTINEFGTRINIVLYDTQSDPDNLTANIRIMSSTDDGSSFSLLTTVTDFASSPSSTDFFGDYINVVDNGGYLFPIWADTRGVDPIYSPPDIFMAKVDQPPEAPKSLTVQGVGTPGAQHPSLAWQQNTDIDFHSYKVYRYFCLYPYCNCSANSALLTTITNRSTTSFVDNNVTIWIKTTGHTSPSLCVHYYVVATDNAGLTSARSNDVTVNSDDDLDEPIYDKKSVASREANWGLALNYPNPFNPQTTILYELVKKEFVRLKIYNVFGEEVANLVNEFQDDGIHSIQFDASNLPSGIYFCRLSAGKYSDVKKMVLVK